MTVCAFLATTEPIWMTGRFLEGVVHSPAGCPTLSEFAPNIELATRFSLSASGCRGGCCFILKRIKSFTTVSFLAPNFCQFICYLTWNKQFGRSIGGIKPALKSCLNSTSKSGQTRAFLPIFFGSVNHQQLTLWEPNLYFMICIIE